MSKMLYRYEINYTSEDGPTSIYLKKLPVIRETEKTYFICGSYGNGERRVLKDAYNTYAYDTKEYARIHFIRRTRKRIAWFKFWIDECEKGLQLIEDEDTK